MPRTGSPHTSRPRCLKTGQFLPSPSPTPSSSLSKPPANSAKPVRMVLDCVEIPQVGRSRSLGKEKAVGSLSPPPSCRVHFKIEDSDDEWDWSSANGNVDVKPRRRMRGKTPAGDEYRNAEERAREKLKYLEEPLVSQSGSFDVVRFPGGQLRRNLLFPKVSRVVGAFMATMVLLWVTTVIIPTLSRAPTRGSMAPNMLQILRAGTYGKPLDRNMSEHAIRPSRLRKRQSLGERICDFWMPRDGDERTTLEILEDIIYGKTYMYPGLKNGHGNNPTV